ncbi:MAG: MBL fold metallo-hydrolase [Elainellaceae cyanobacterium]
MKLFRQAATALFSFSIMSIGGISAAQEQDFSDVAIETVPVAENLYMLLGEGGNIGVLAGDDGVFLIDDQFAPLTDKILAAVGEISEQPIRFLVNTHWHFDHTGGNENLGNAGVLIVAHDEVYTRMSTEQFIEAFQRPIPASPSAALPVITFSDTTTFHINGQTVHAFHVDPAHTDGDTVIHFTDADVIHAGDTYFNGLYPFIDTSSGGSIVGMIQAAERILALAGDETQIIPGHGPLSNRAELEAYRQMLVTVRVRTERAIAQGLTLEEFLASDPTVDYDDAWGGGFLNPEQFLTIVYQDLAE